MPMADHRCMQAIRIVAFLLLAVLGGCLEMEQTITLLAVSPDGAADPVTLTTLSGS